MLQEQQPAPKADEQIPGVTDIVQRRAKVNRLLQHVADLEVSHPNDDHQCLRVVVV